MEIFIFVSILYWLNFTSEKKRKFTPFLPSLGTSRRQFKTDIFLRMALEIPPSVWEWISSVNFKHYFTSTNNLFFSWDPYETHDSHTSTSHFLSTISSTFFMRIHTSRVKILFICIMISFYLFVRNLNLKVQRME